MLINNGELNWHMGTWWIHTIFVAIFYNLEILQAQMTCQLISNRQCWVPPSREKYSLFKLISYSEKLSLWYYLMIFLYFQDTNYKWKAKHGDMAGNQKDFAMIYPKIFLVWDFIISFVWFNYPKVQGALYNKMLLDDQWFLINC